MVCKVIIWVSWVVCALVLPDRFHMATFGLGLVSSCLTTFLVMFLPRPRQLAALGREEQYMEDPTHSQEELHWPSKGRHGPRILSQEGESVYQQGGSYLGFHRPLGVMPPSSSPQSQTPPTVYTLPPSYLAGYPSHTHFPSHFYPDKLYQYWHHYHPRINPYQKLDTPLPYLQRRHESPQSRSPKSSAPTLLWSSGSPIRNSGSPIRSS